MHPCEKEPQFSKNKKEYACSRWEIIKHEPNVTKNRVLVLLNDKTDEKLMQLKLEKSSTRKNTGRPRNVILDMKYGIIFFNQNDS